MKRHINCLYIIFLLTFSHWAAAEWANDEKLVQETLHPYLATSNPAQRREYLEQQRNRLARLAADTPESHRSATLVFATGMTPSQIVELGSTFNLDVTEVMIQIPLNELGVVQSITIGRNELTAIDGSLKERLEYAIGWARSWVLESGKGKSGKRAEDHMRMANRPWKVYSIEAEGTLKSISELADTTDVAGVFLQLWSWGGN